MTSKSIRALTLALALAVSGCTDGSEPTSPRPVASVSVQPAQHTLSVGDEVVLTATALDEEGAMVEGYTLAWSSSDEAVASITSAGRVKALRPGTVRIAATAAGKIGTAELTVRSAYELLYRRRGENDISDIMALQLDTGAAPVAIASGLPSTHPTASPDGRRIAYAVLEYDALSEWNERVSSIYSADRNGQDVRRLTRGSGSEDQPAWSPNGDRIAYRHADSSGRTDIWVMNADGSSSVNLTADMPVDENRHAPSWSPDGTRIAFASEQSTSAGVESSIWTMRADGTAKARITSTATGFDTWPTWSPDGLRIAFIRQYDVDGDITIVSASGAAPVRLSLPGRQLTPSWSPDGETIAFVQPGVGVLNVYTVRPDGTNVRLRTVEPAWGGGVEPTWIRAR